MAQFAYTITDGCSPSSPCTTGNKIVRQTNDMPAWKSARTFPSNKILAGESWSGVVPLGGDYSLVVVRHLSNVNLNVVTINSF